MNAGANTEKADSGFVLACKELDEVINQTRKAKGAADVTHLRLFETAGFLCTITGYLTGIYFLNPLSAYLVALGNFASWMMAHHILHGGYNSIPGVPNRLTSKGFGQGIRRWIDWLDWIHPDAWKYEHNSLHHTQTSERGDPDNVERLFKDIRKANMPVAIKYLITILIAFTWKWSYYAPSTWMHLMKKKGKVHPKSNNFYKMYDFTTPVGRSFWWQCMLPYPLVRFVLIPLLFLPFGKELAINALWISIIADLLANFHSFLMIGPNHTADDLYRFTDSPKGKTMFIIHQLYSTINYKPGGFILNFWHGYMNYHIEHHIQPDFTMRQYEMASTPIRVVCSRYHLPYRSESVFRRFRKMFSICVGSRSTIIFSD